MTPVPPIDLNAPEPVEIAIVRVSLTMRVDEAAEKNVVPERKAHDSGHGLVVREVAASEVDAAFGRIGEFVFRHCRVSEITERGIMDDSDHSKWAYGPRRKPHQGKMTQHLSDAWKSCPRELVVQLWVS